MQVPASHISTGSGTNRAPRASAGGARCCVISETNVAPLYADAAEKSLAAAGYDVADYRNVDPRLGTLDDFDRVADAAWIGSLRKGRMDTATLLESLGQLKVRGVNVNWAAVFGEAASRQRVNQELKTMEREGAIRIEPAGLVVLDRDALLRISLADS